MEAESTDWLSARRVIHSIPRSIENEATVHIDGIFTFRVKRPRENPTGRSFVVEDTIKLGGHLSGIERPIRGFHTPKKIKLQHPIEMSQPRFLRCLTVGQEAVFSWKVYAYKTLS